MKDRTARGANYGPWLVGLGAALWGTESAWRIPLNELFDADVIVFWEHVLILLMFLPLLLPKLGELRKIDISTWGYLLFSGFAGSAVGTIFFTLALKHGNPTVVNVVLNIQPVISTLGAFLLFRDRCPSRHFSFRRVSRAHRSFVRARRIKYWHWLRFDLRVFLGRFNRRRSRCHDGYAASTCI